MANTAETNKLLPQDLYKIFVKNHVVYFCGVPDSILSSFGLYLEDHAGDRHDIAANEGNAIGLAIGYFLATSKLALLYMQNSGLGNAINPLVSLADSEVLGIPMILLIGWRGQPGKVDEPQHIKQGKITTILLDNLHIPYIVLSRKSDKVSEQVAKACRNALIHKRPFALLVEPNTIGSYKTAHDKHNDSRITREQAIGCIVGSLDDKDILVATTGKTARELFEYRRSKYRSHKKDLLVVGGMGHASSIAMSIAEQKLKQNVYCIDGDGALIMHMGALATIANKKLKNFNHIVINNGSHESVGGQQTVGLDIDIPAVAKACGYKFTHSVANLADLNKTLNTTKRADGPILIEVCVNKKSRPNLGRPSIKPSKNKQDFMAFLKKL